MNPRPYTINGIFGLYSEAEIKAENARLYREVYAAEQDEEEQEEEQETE